MYALAGSLDPDSYHRLARAAYAEMAQAGISVVGEFHYLHHGPGGRPYDDPNAMSEAVIAAAADAGLRITLLDTCYLRGGIGVDPDETQRRFSDGDALSWATRAGALAARPGVRIGAAIHSVRAVEPASMAIVAAWAAERAAPLHAHVSEQPAENEQSAAAYGRTPTELLADRGVLGERFTAVHATHLTGGDVDHLGRAGCWCCFCPTTERDLADGIGPARALRDAGARLTLGSDSHAVIDPLEEARAVELDERLASGVRGSHEATALLRMACEHGHDSLGWPDGGRIAAGAHADLTTIGFDSVRMAGTTAEHALAAAVFAATAADVRHVVIGGRVVVRDGEHTAVDVVGELQRVLA
jgi:formiminoglutamate deiminase